MNKKTLPPPEPEPVLPQSNYQQLGYLRLLRGSISLACVKLRGVELILSSGLSLCIPLQEIRRQGFQTNREFADCLELGAHFPTIKFALHSMKDFRPHWADSWGEAPTGCPTPPPEPKLARPKAPPLMGIPQDEDDTQPSDQPAAPVQLPLPKLLPPYRGGGVGMGGR